MNGLFHFEIKDEAFIEWLKETENSFMYMMRTMNDVAIVVKENTIPLTPFDEGDLSRSFKTFEVEDTSDMKVIRIEMSAVNNGYDYAAIQHENLSYSHPSKKNRYGRHGEIASANIMSGLSGTNNPQALYLREGIIQSKEGAFQIIEEDYLSLFRRGYIV